jgi:hypothetical protein
MTLAAGRCRSQDVPPLLLLLLFVLSPATTRRLAGGAAAGGATPRVALVLWGAPAGVGAAVGLKNNRYTTKLIKAKARTVKLEKDSSIMGLVVAAAAPDMAEDTICGYLIQFRAKGHVGYKYYIGWKLGVIL